MTELKPTIALQGRGIGAHPDKMPGDDLEHVFIRNALVLVARALFPNSAEHDADQKKATQERVRAALRTGELRAATHSEGSFYDIRAERWFGDEREINRRFEEGKMTTFEGFSSSRWWFLERDPLQNFIFKMGGLPPSAEPFEFDMDEWRWRLFDACVWVATEGQPTTTADAYDAAEEGARILFRKLDQLGPKGPKVTGLRIGESRLPVLSTMWERAHTGWLGFSAGHRIDFKQDPEVPGEVRADLHMNSLSGISGKPFCTDLRIDRDEFLALFPAKEPSPGTKKRRGGPRTAADIRDETECSRWLVEDYMSNAPAQPVAKGDLRPLAEKKWPNMTDNGWQRAWSDAVAAGPYPRWAEGGDNRGKV